MKTTLKNHEQGNALLVALMLTTTSGLFLGSYLKLTSSAVLSSSRSLAWNHALVVAETGIEEGLNAIASIELTGLPSIGWVQNGMEYTKTRNMGDGTSYETTISGTTNAPIITTIGYYPFYGTPSGQISRGLTVDASRRSILHYSILTKDGVDAKGNKIKFDSFDSRDPLWSTNGLYEPTRFKDNGGIATNSDAIDSLGIGNSEVYGTINTGPEGTASIARNGAVGSKTWIDGGNSGVETGAYLNDMNVAIPDVVAPSSFSPAPTPYTDPVTGEFYDYALLGGPYQMSSLSMENDEEMRVYADSELYVTGNISITGNAKISIAPGASLTLYVGGPTVHIGGNGVSNEGGLAENFIMKGLNSLTSVSLSGNFEFIGVVYVPHADVTIGGGGSDVMDISGALVSKSLVINGKATFHYDEALEDLDKIGAYIVDDWKEI